VPPTFKHLQTSTPICRRRRELNQGYFDYVTFFQPPYRLKKLALLFTAQLEMPHHLLNRDLSRPAPLKPMPQIIHDKPLNLSALPSGVPNESGN